jgi:ATP-dependent helicase/DNAse subunit B
MFTDLVLAPVGAGKTEKLLDTLVRTVQEQPFAPIWVLLPTSRQEDAFRQRLAEQGSRVYFNVNFFNFYTLYARLLDMAGQPQRQLDDTARLRLLRQILTELKSTGQLSVYGGIADTPGFVRIVADFIYELKQNVIRPEAFSEVAAVGRAKDRDLALIYSEYQNTLQRNQLVDKEGEGWLALDEVDRRLKIGREIALLLVDGFDQFNPLQSQLLALLSSRVQRSLITLPTVPERENTVGRRFDEAYLKLQMVFERTGHPLNVTALQPLSKVANGLRAYRPSAECHRLTTESC